MTAARQPKGIPTGGQFAPGFRSESAVTLGPPTPPETSTPVSGWQLYQAALERETSGALAVNKYPDRKSDAKRLLRNSRGEQDGAVRVVHLNYTNAPDSKTGEHVDVVGPKDGRPIAVMIGSGIPRLKVTSGKAIIHADSSWGNSIDVAAGAQAIIVASSDRKVTTTVESGGQATFISNSGDNRFRPFVRNGARLDLVVGLHGEKERYVPEPIDPDFFTPIQKPAHSPSDGQEPQS